MRILLFLFLMASLFCIDAARAQAYSDYHWHDVESPDLSVPPVLARGDTLDLFQGALYFDRQVIWILNNANHFEFLIWNIETKASRYIPFGPERIRGMAWNASTHEVVIRPKGFSLMDLCKPVIEWKLEEQRTRSYSGPDSTIEKLPKNQFFDLNSQNVLE